MPPATVVPLAVNEFGPDKVRLAPWRPVPPWFLTVTWIEPIGSVTVTFVVALLLTVWLAEVTDPPPSVAVTV